MYINENGFTYKDFVEKFTDKEKAFIIELVANMTDLNYVYIYQKTQRDKRDLLTRIGNKLGVDRRTAQNIFYNILNTQEERLGLNWIIMRGDKRIKGEYVISPDFALKDKSMYNDIYKHLYGDRECYEEM